jgi:ligand-binding sensor domain-containing protein
MPGGLRVGAGVLAGVLCAGNAAALDPGKAITQYVHDVWRTGQGLPIDDVKDIAQTPDGYLWLATDEGLVRFDGVRFETFDRHSTPPLTPDNVYALCVDREGALWIGGEGALVRWHRGAFKAYGAADGFDAQMVAVIVEDPDGSLWIGTRGQGLYRWKDGRFQAYRTREGLANDHVLSLLVDRAGDLWVGTRGGAQRISKGAFREQLTSRDGLASDVVNGFYQDRGGVLWIGTFAGLHRREAGRLTRFTTRDGLSHDLVGPLLEDADGNLWIGTFGGGLTRFRDGQFKRFTAAEGLSDDLVTRMFLDRQGSLWIGTHLGGLNRLQDGALVTFGVKEGLSHDKVRAVYEDAGGALWTATQGGGLNRLQGGRVTTFRTRDGLLSDHVFSLQGDREGGLWVGSYNGGLNRLRNGRFTAIKDPALPINEFITCILEDREGTLWLGTYGGGLKSLRDGRVTTYRRQDGLSDDYIWALAEDRAGSLWIATTGGLTQRHDGGFRRFAEAEGLSDRHVWSLLADDDGVLWVGTESGLTRVREGRLFSFTSRHGLSFDEKLMQVLDDREGYLWLGGYRGLFRVQKSALEDVAAGRASSVTPLAFGVGDGMRSAVCDGSTQPAAWRGRDGRLWFSTNQGVVMTDPARLRQRPPAPPVTMEEVVVDEQRLAQVAGAAADPLPPGRRQYEFHYTSLDLRSAQRMRFRYRLDGVDDDWVDAGQRRTAYYTSVPPGRHLFRVAASRGDDLWSESPATFEFRVRPHFYQTWWFLGACALGAGLAGWAGHRYRLRRVLETERVRTRIASDLHDDIGSSLSQIAILSEVARAQLGAPAAPAAEPLARIGALSRESVDAMGDIVWALDPQKDRLTHLAQRMRRHADDVLSARGMELRFDADDRAADRPVAAELRRQVFLIFKEALHNVARHSSARQVQVGLAVADGRLVLSVADDGTGFESEAGSSGHGLRSMKRRAEGLGGTLDVKSAPGTGTRLRLAVPV